MKTLNILVLCTTLVALSAGGGYWFARHHTAPAKPFAPAEMAPASASESEKKVLYWYDPMVPNQHFDQPGKSPFMDMQLVPKYADAGGDSAGITIDSRVQQNLALRRATVERRALSPSIEVLGTVSFNQRDVAVVQVRSNGFVERVYARAPGDVIAANAPLADVLIPEWTGAQIEFLTLRHNGDPELTAAARQRLTLLGMSSELIAQIERTGKPQTTVTLKSPIAGVIDTLEVRQGMSVGMGMTLAKIVGIGTVWLEVAVPEAQAAQVREGLSLKARLSAYPEECFQGRIIAVLPDTNAETRTLKVRVELQNPEGRLRPGMTAHVWIDIGETQPLLWVPSETVIRTGKRNVVIVALNKHSFLPVDVETGRETQGKTAILRGLKEGQTVVASGQFLIDSEASLSGVLQKFDTGGEVRDNADRASMKTPERHQAEGKIEAVSAHELTISHGPISSLKWGAMTMPFTLAQPDLTNTLQPGDRIRFEFTAVDGEFEIQSIEKTGDQP